MSLLTMYVLWYLCNQQVIIGLHINFTIYTLSPFNRENQYKLMIWIPDQSKLRGDVITKSLASINPTSFQPELL